MQTDSLEQKEQKTEKGENSRKRQRYTERETDPRVPRWLGRVT